MSFFDNANKFNKVGRVKIIYLLYPHFYILKNILNIFFGTKHHLLDQNEKVVRKDDSS